MDKNIDTTKLTEFAPLHVEEKPQGVSQLFSKFFKFGKSSTVTENPAPVVEASPTDSLTPDVSAWTTIDDKDDASSKSSESGNVQISVDMSEGRSLPNVLKRISNLVALKSNNLQAYGDTELRKYWMPDSVSKECYECSERFSTFRRRHHCRVCGQIFCSRCCSQEIPGKIMNCTGDLRVCTYCCKVVLSYLQSADMCADLTADLRELQEDLQIKFGSSGNSISSISGPVAPGIGSLTVAQQLGSLTGLSVGIDNSDNTTLRRKISVGYQEEKFAADRASTATGMSIDERCKALQNSMSLRSLYDDIYNETNNGGGGLSLSSHRHRLRTYNLCLTGSQLVDWLINHHKAGSRAQATALGQALLEAGYIESVIESPGTNGIAGASFSDSPTGLYRPRAINELPFEPPSLQIGTLTSPGTAQTQTNETEPAWVDQIAHDGATTDSEAESHVSPQITTAGMRVPSSSSSFYLDLDLEASTVHLVRPLQTESINNDDITTRRSSEDVPRKDSDVGKEAPVLQNNVDREVVPISGWHNAKQLRQDNGELESYNALTETFQQHESALLCQLLCSEGLPLSWASIIQPLIHEVVDVVTPDYNHSADMMDIREYVRFKAVAGGDRSDSKVVRGIVCSKNVAHRSMGGRREAPRVLLLACALVYQRNEGRLMSLEPVIMQEHEYLRNVTARIVALRPNVVLVERTASRLAQELLRDAGITLAHNVKFRVLERIARTCSADVVSSVDAHIGRPRLATCHEFYTRSFYDHHGGCKTLMFFEGLPNSHLGCTVLLRGANIIELKKLKSVAQKLLFACYNWRLERSFLMDQFAKPPCPKQDSFFEDNSSRENSPDEKSRNDEMSDGTETDQNVDDGVFNEKGKTENSPQNLNKSSKINCFHDSVDSCEKCNVNIKNNKERNTNDDKKLSTKSVSDFSDPLQCFSTYENDDPSNSQKMAVSEMPFGNKFRKALDDTVLSISPYLSFTIPFLESENGRKCKLRKFFPSEIYYSAQFSDKFENTATKIDSESNRNLEKVINRKLRPAHPFISTKFTTNTDNKEVQTLLAHFRACGGRLLYQDVNGIQSTDAKLENKTTSSNSQPHNVSGFPDALKFDNHQRLAVLFCSFSYESNNAPAFCVNPWTVIMDFYGRNDIALGNFLERYCFRESYVCPSPTCGTPMLNHHRRFVHHNGCVSVTLNKLDNQLPSPSSAPDEDKCIVMWSWCTKCNTVSPVVPMSNDTWSFSFAKYLELKFHGHMYSRRGKNETCPHSLHHDHYQYFGLKNIVASFKYTPVNLWEVSLPPPLIEYHYDITIPHDTVIDEIKVLALRGHEVFSTILEKLMTITNDSDEIGTMTQQLQKDQANFKLKIEEVQLKLTSPSLENKLFDADSQNTELRNKLWHLEDSLINVKRLIVETCEIWNSRLIESSKSDGKRSQSKLNDNKPLTPLMFTDKSDDTDATDMESSSSPDYNAVDIVNASNLVIESLTSESIASTDTAVAPNVTRKIKSLDQTEFSVSEESTASTGGSASPKGNPESNIVQQHEDSQHDTRKEEKKTVKTILSQLLPSEKAAMPIQCPISSQEHYLLPMGASTIPIVVYESEPSSIIAYALNSMDYRKALDEKVNVIPHPIILEQSPSPIHRRKGVNTATNEKVEKNENSNEQIASNENRHSGGILSFLRTNSQSISGIQNLSTGEGSSVSTSETEDTSPIRVVNGKPQDGSATVTDSKTKHKQQQTTPVSTNIEIQFQDASANFFCRIYCAEQFAALRKMVLADNSSKNTPETTSSTGGITECEEKYIRSLARSIQWNARGGKSGSAFSKTKDDRFILKEMSKIEMQLFLDSAQNYFTYMQQCLSQGLPTLLGKIVGVYRVIYRSTATSVGTNPSGSSSGGLRQNLLVMENLFYRRNVPHKFDLKGSDRNRLVNPDSASQDGEIVFLDENLLKMTCKSPLYILPHSKAVLTSAIHNDTEFLANQSVMDYSLLVGLDHDTKELVVGIIDYIRTFTWDKKLETMVKKTGILGGQGKLPTIVAPQEYRARFIAAMHRYFLLVPGRWAGLGRGLD